MSWAYWLVIAIEALVVVVTILAVVERRGRR